MNKQGILLIISGPSGSGKGTIVERLCEKNNFSLSISATTRKPREYEKDGVHYFFHTREEFEKMRDRKELLEWAEFCGNYYGTPRKYVTEQLMAGNNVILEIEVQGALQVKKIYPEGVLIFMVPPNLEELGNRLTKRGTEDKETINKRLRRALEEMELVEEYDYLVINDTVEQATEDMLTIVAAESKRFSKERCNMLRPSYSDILEVITQDSEDITIASRYTIVIAAAKRARQLVDHQQPMIDHIEVDKPVSIAVNEIYEGKLKIREGKPEEEDKEVALAEVDFASMAEETEEE